MKVRRLLNHMKTTLTMYNKLHHSNITSEQSVHGVALPVDLGGVIVRVISVVGRTCH